MKDCRCGLLMLLDKNVALCNVSYSYGFVFCGLLRQLIDSRLAIVCVEKVLHSSNLQNHQLFIFIDDVMKLSSYRQIVYSDELLWHYAH